MSKDNSFLKNGNFAPGRLFTGLIKDIPDKRDYKFSDIMKQQGTIKTIKVKVLKPKPLKRGCFRKHGYKIPLEEVTVAIDVATPKLLSSSPFQIDHSKNMSLVKDQKNLGTCVAFSAAALKECQEKEEHDREVVSGKEYNRDKEYDYSEQWIYWNCKKIDGFSGSEGTTIRDAMKVLKNIGVPTEQAWPYTDDPVNIGKPASWANMIARWATIGSYWNVSNLTELKAALVEGPVIIGVPVFAEWWEPPGGVVNYPSNPSLMYGGHAICAVGYDESKHLVKFKNSWSTYWGEQGYGYLSYRYIEDFLWSGWAARDISVTRDMLKGTREL
jgi:hypothetical protein